MTANGKIALATISHILTAKPLNGTSSRTNGGTATRMNHPVVYSVWKNASTEFVELGDRK
jgi:hypothetical protein